MYEQLISLRTQAGVTLHAYSINVERENLTEKISSKICEIAEEQGFSYLPLILATNLSDGGKVVRDIVCANSSDAEEKYQRVIDGKETFFFSIFVIPVGCEWDSALMALH